MFTSQTLRLIGSVEHPESGNKVGHNNKMLLKNEHHEQMIVVEAKTRGTVHHVKVTAC